MDIGLMCELFRAGFPLTPVTKIFEDLNIPPGLAKKAEFKIPELFPNAYQIAARWFLTPSYDQLFGNIQNFFYLQKLKDDWVAATHNAEARGEGPLEALCNLYLETKK